MTKKLLALLVGGAMMLTACSTDVTTSQSEESTTSADSTSNTEKIEIVATSFHEYDWVNEIIGEDNTTFNVTLLMDNGVDLHSYEPSVEDISVISSADLFIYNGGPSHDWIADVLADPLNEDLKSINVMQELGDAVKMEIAVEGMQIGEHAHDHADEDEHDHADEDTHDHADEDTHDHADEDEHDHADEDEHDHADEDEHDHADEDEHDHEETGHEDEHVWLSLNNAIAICGILEGALSELDADNAATYEANLASYVALLSELDESFESAIEAAPRDTLVFTDRFPFLYLMQDYDVNYYAAFQGCSAETEATFQTVAFLSDKVDELDIKTLLILENGLADLAQTVSDNSEDQDCQILELNSIQSISADELASGETYYSIMQSNLEILKTALQ